MMLRTTLLCLTLATIQCSFAQDAPEPVELGTKLKRYHAILLKRPNSSKLYERFQSAWLSKYEETTLEAFLKQQAAAGGVQHKQIYAFYLLEKGLDNEAITLLDEALKLETKNPHLLVDRARAAARLLDFTDALKYAEKGRKHAPEGDDIFKLSVNKLIGKYLAREGKTDEAVAHWKALAEANQKDQDLIEDVIDVLINDGLSEAALEHAEKLRNDTKDPYKRALRTLRVADITLRNGQQDKAIEVYEKALDMSGVDSWLEREVLAQIALAYQQEENETGLLKKLEVLVKKHPLRFQIAQKYAEQLASSGELKNAKTVYQEVIKRSPNNESLKVAYLKMLREAEDYESALLLLDTFIEKDNQNADYHVQRAEISHAIGEKDKALESLKKYASIVKPSPSTLLRYAQILKGYEFFKEASEQYEKAVKLYPESEEVLFTVATHYVEKNDFAKAEALWKTLGAAPSIDSFSRLMDTLMLHRKLDLAVEIIEKNRNRLKIEQSYHNASYRVAIAKKAYQRAIKHGESMLILSKQPSDVDKAVDATVEAYAKAEKLDEAIKFYQSKELRFAEKFVLAGLLEEVGEMNAANEIIEGLIASDDIAALLQVVKIHERRFQLEEAASVMEKILTLPKGIKTIHLRRLFELYDFSGNNEMAIKTLKKWKTYAPNDKNAWLAEAEYLEFYESKEKALKVLRRSQERFDDEPEIYANIARLYSRTGEYKRALKMYWKLYDEASNLDEKILHVNELVEITEDWGGSDELLETLAQRRRSSPNSITPIMSLAEVHRLLGNHQKRRDYLLEANRLKPQDATILTEIAMIDIKRGDKAKGIAMLQRAKLVDKLGVVSRKLARIYMEDGDFQKALEELDSVVSLKNDPREVERLAIVLMEQLAYDEAREYIVKNSIKFPEDWRLKILECIIEYELGNSEASLRKSLDLLKQTNEYQKISMGWNARKEFIQNDSTQFPYSKMPLHCQDLLIFETCQSNLEKLGGTRAHYSYGFISYLPKDVHSMHALMRLHIARLIRESDPQQKKEFLEQAKSGGFYFAKEWAEVAVADTERSYYDRHELRIVPHLKKDKENPYLIDFVACQSAFAMSFGLDEKIYNKVKSKFAKETSQLAEYARCFHVNRAKPSEFLNFLKTHFENKEKVQNREFSALSGFRVLTEFDEDEKYYRSIPPEGRQVLTELAKRYCRQHLGDVDPFLPRQQSLPYLVESNITRAKRLLLREVMESKDYSRIIKLVEARAFDESGSNQFYIYEIFDDIENLILSGIPRILTNVSDTQKHAFDGGNYSLVQDIDEKQLKTHLKDFQNPLLKAIVINRHYKQEGVEEILKACATQPKYQADAYLMLAFYKNQKLSHPKEVIEYLDKAAKSTKSRAQRAYIDGLMAFYAYNKDYSPGFKKLEGSTLEKCRVAARRLMISRMIFDVSDRSAMVKSLKMKEEAGRFLGYGVARSLFSGQSKGAFIMDKNHRGHYYGRGNRNYGLFPVYMRQMTIGDEKEAVNKSVKWFASKPYIVNKEQYLSRLIGVNGHAEDILKKLHPGESSNPRKWLSYYSAADFLENETATAEAESFFLKNSNVPGVLNMHIARLLVSSHPKRSARYLMREADANVVYRYVNSCKNWVIKEDIATRLNYSIQFAEYLNFLSKEEKNNWTGLSVCEEIFNSIQEKYLTDEQKKEYAHCKLTFESYLKNHHSSITDKLKELESKAKADKAVYSEMLDYALERFVFLQDKEEHGYYQAQKAVKQTLLTALYHTKKQNVLSEEILKDYEDKFFVRRYRRMNHNISLTQPELIKEITNFKPSKDSGRITQYKLFAENDEKVRDVYTKTALDMLILQMEKWEKKNIRKLYTYHDFKTSELIHLYTNLLKHSGIDEVEKCLNRLNAIYDHSKTSKKPELEWVRDMNKGAGARVWNAAILYNTIMQGLLSDPLTFTKGVDIANKHRFPLLRPRYYPDFPQHGDLVDKLKKAGFIGNEGTFHWYKIAHLELEDVQKMGYSNLFESDGYEDYSKCNYSALANVLKSQANRSKHRQRVEKALEEIRMLRNKGDIGATVLMHFYNNYDKFSLVTDKIDYWISRDEAYRKTLIDNLDLSSDIHAYTAQLRLHDIFPFEVDKEQVEKKVLEIEKKYKETGDTFSEDEMYFFTNQLQYLYSYYIATEQGVKAKKLIGTYIPRVKEFVKRQGSSNFSFGGDWTLNETLAGTFYGYESDYAHQDVYTHFEILVNYLDADFRNELILHNLFYEALGGLWLFDKHSDTMMKVYVKHLLDYEIKYKELDVAAKRKHLLLWHIFFIENNYRREKMMKCLAELKAKGSADSFFANLYEIASCYMYTDSAVNIKRYGRDYDTIISEEIAQQETARMSKKLAQLLEEFDVYERAILLNHFYENHDYEESKDILKVLRETYVEVSNDDQLMKRLDRNIIFMGYIHQHLQDYSEVQRKELFEASKKYLALMVSHVASGGSVEGEQLLKIADIVSQFDEGKDVIRQMVAKNIDDFKGVNGIAAILVNCGEVELAKKLFVEGKVKDWGRYPVEITPTIQFNENRKKLLELYQSSYDKAAVHWLIQPDDTVEKDAKDVLQRLNTALSDPKVKEDVMLVYNEFLNSHPNVDIKDISTYVKNVDILCSPEACVQNVRRAYSMANNLFSGYITALAEEKGIDGLTAYVDPILNSEEPSSSNYQYYYVLEYTADATYPAVIDLLNQSADKEKCLHLLRSSCYALMKRAQYGNANYQYYQWKEFGRMLYLTDILHREYGYSEVFEKWKNSKLDKGYFTTKHKESKSYRIKNILEDLLSHTSVKKVTDAKYMFMKNEEVQAEILKSEKLEPVIRLMSNLNDCDLKIAKSDTFKALMLSARLEKIARKKQVDIFKEWSSQLLELIDSSSDISDNVLQECYLNAMLCHKYLGLEYKQLIPKNIVSKMSERNRVIYKVEMK